MKHNIEAFKKYYINATKDEVIEDMFLDNCNLQQEIERLNNKVEELMTLYTTERNVKKDYKSIIKEVREFIYKCNDGKQGINYSGCSKLLEILDKGE